MERDIYIEDKSQELNQKVYNEYLKSIKLRGKAALIGVCRGKLAEGIDFSDEAARAVVMAGIPYPSVFEPRVILKRDYIEQKYKAGTSLINGTAWYTQ